MLRNSIWGIDVVISDAARDTDGNPAWCLIPKLPSLMPGAKQFLGSEPQTSDEDVLLEIKNMLADVGNVWYPMPEVVLVCHSKILENIRVLIERRNNI